MTLHTLTSAIAYARSLIGVTGPAYAALIRAPGYELASGCGLVAGRGYLAHVLALPPSSPLLLPYRDQMAIHDIVAAGNDADAISESVLNLDSWPECGDVVHLGSGSGGPEHVYVCAHVEPPAYDMAEIESVEGGRRVGGAGSAETVAAQPRWISRDGDGRMWDRHEGVGSQRPVLGWVSLAACAEWYGWAEA